MPAIKIIILNINNPCLLPTQTVTKLTTKRFDIA